MDEVKEKTQQQSESNNLIVVVTASVYQELSRNEIDETFEQLKEKMKKQDPENPDLWTVQISGYELWGILDHKAGPNKEDVLTILFPSDY